VQAAKKISNYKINRFKRYQKHELLYQKEKRTFIPRDLTEHSGQL